MNADAIEIGRFYAVVDRERQVVTTGIVTARNESEWIVRTVRDGRFLRVQRRTAFRRELTDEEVLACLRAARVLANETRAARVPEESGGSADRGDGPKADPRRADR